MNIAKSINVGMALMNIKVSDIKEKLGVTSVTVSYWRNRRSDPSLAKVEQLAELFGVKVSTFIQWGE